MNLKSLFTISALAISAASYAQEAETTSSPLQISGSVDTYYKYDFSKRPNIGTSFANDQNSISLGMIDLALKKTTGKASFVGELSFGPRGQGGSLLPGDSPDGTESFHIQNLYTTYAFTDKFSMTAGYMGTFIGYEIISPTGNFNYSTSYLFTNGPFQNAGIKANYVFSPKVALMVGLFNDWNVYKDENGVSHFGAQLTLSPAEGWTAYLNMLTGRAAGAPGTGSIYDLTTSYQATESFKVGLNAATYSVSNNNGGYSGAALYLQNAFSSSVALGLRGEYFKSKDDVDGMTLSGVVPGESVFALTVSGNLKAGGLTFIPEIRFDNGSSEQFLKKAGDPTKSASQFSLAAVYAF
ncbi:porin [Pedobacter sp. AW31-3R]|uniref:porin n=1 Tax=Pedobacter sp. AW31-3R TaxID=3445781 RepID=UPI003FA10563